MVNTYKIIDRLYALAVKCAAARPYTYSKGAYTFTNIGNKQQALADIDKRYSSLTSTWDKYTPDLKKAHKESYKTKMQSIADEKNRLSEEYGHTWRYRFNSRSGKIEAYRELKNMDPIAGQAPLLDAPSGVQEVIRAK